MDKSTQPMQPRQQLIVQGQIMNPEEFKKEIVDGKLRIILGIVGYCMLIIGSLGVYVSLFMGKITLGKIHIGEKTLKKITAMGLILIWSLFLIAESIRLDNLNNP
jgi:hypothetical protein